MTKFLSRNYHFAIFLLVVSGFLFVACQRLGTVPVYETDESFTLQVPYEMLHHRKLALPMYRYLGGNIENAWHSYTPVYFVLLGGFLKVFGFGVVQGRAFNLITAVLTLLMVYLIGRKLFDWRVGLIATLMLVSDLTFLERSRLLRNDYAAAMFALLAFYLYQRAEERGSWRLILGSGVAAGAGVMCHTNVLYMLGVIGILMVFKKGWRAFSSRELYIFTTGALAVMAYEIIYDLIDLKNFLLQNRQDSLHFGVLESGGLWQNVLRERLRYVEWYSGGGIFPAVPRTLLHLFQVLTVIAVIYLLVRAVRGVRRRINDDPRKAVLVATAVTVLFIALLGGNKEIYYISHLAPWFAICVGVLVTDGLAMISRFRASSFAWARPARIAVSGAVLIVIAMFGYQLVKQNVTYVREARNPNLVSFQEIANVLAATVPEGLCPVAIKAPVIWLAFPEMDRCFADIEARMAGAVDIDGKDYALVSRPRNLRNLAEDVDQKYHLIGELFDTAYGTLAVYYTGSDPRYLSLAARRYYFFNELNGHVSDEQIAAGREIWSASNSEAHGGTSTASLIEVSLVELAPNMIYQIAVEGASTSGWELVIVDERTGDWSKRVALTGNEHSGSVSELFRNPIASRVRLAVRPLNAHSADSIRISRISIREVGQL